MRKKNKLPLLVICGSSVENGKAVFWALDTSDTRLYVKPETTRVDVLFDTLYDFLGKEPEDSVVFKPTVGSKRLDQIIAYIQKRTERYETESDTE